MVIATQAGEGEANASSLELPEGGVDAPNLRYFVMALFFIFGGITSLNDVIIPKLKELFTLNYTQAMLVQFCFFTAYLVIGIPGAQLVKKIGYMRGAVAGPADHDGRLPAVHPRLARPRLTACSCSRCSSWPAAWWSSRSWRTR